MASNNKYDLTFATASETFGRLVQVVDGDFYDGLGNTIGELSVGSYDVISVATESDTGFGLGFGLAADVYQGLTQNGDITTFNIKGIRAENDSIIVTQDDNNVYLKTKQIQPPSAEWIISNVSCNGLSNGQIVINTFGGTADKKYSIDGGLNWLPTEGSTQSTTATFSNLSSGNYTLVVFDFGLSFNTLNQPVTLTQPGIINFNRTVVGVTTTSQGDGKITFTNLSGGTPPYEYSINGGSNYQQSNIFNNLIAANYTLIVRDSNGCLSSTQSVTITGPAPISISSVTLTNPTCPGSNGNIFISIGNGSGRHQYSTDGGVTYIPSGGVTNRNINVSVGAGTYNIRVKDFNTGEITNWIDPVTISDPPGKSIKTFTVNNGLGGNPASIFIEVENAVGTLRWSLNGTTFNNFSNNSSTTIQNNNFSAGTTTGTVYIKDDCQTDIQENFTIIKTTGISANISSTIRPACPGDNWVYTFNVSGGSGQFQYSLDNNNWISYTTGSNISIRQSSNESSPTTTTIRFRDSENISDTNQINLNNSQVIPLSVTLQLNLANCSGGTTTLTATVTGGEVGGTNQFQYALVTGSSVGTYTNSNTYNLLSNGSYSIRVRRLVNGQPSTSCEVQPLSQSVTLPTPVQFTFTKTDPTTCGGQGNVSIIPSGGTPPYQYRVGSGNWTNLIGDISLNPGEHTIVIKDDNGCQSSTQQVTIVGPEEVDFSITYTRPNCNGGQATITITPNKGVGPFTISSPQEWTRQGSDPITLNSQVQYLGQPTSSNVSFTVTDTNTNCVKTKGITGTGQPSVVSLSNITVITGGGLTGNISGGTPGYRLVVIGSNNDQITGSPFNVNSSINLNASQVPVGSYTVKGLDLNNCESSIVSVNVPAAPPPAFVYFFKFRFNGVQPNIFFSTGREYRFEDVVYANSTNNFAVTSIGDVANHYINNLSSFFGGSINVSNQNNWNGMELNLGSGNFGGFNVAVLVPSSKNFSNLLSGNKIVDTNGSSVFNANSRLNVTINGIIYELYNIYGNPVLYGSEKIKINN